jgi:hypothetical protein
MGKRGTALRPGQGSWAAATMQCSPVTFFDSTLSQTLFCIVIKPLLHWYALHRAATNLIQPPLVAGSRTELAFQRTQHDFFNMLSWCLFLLLISAGVCAGGTTKPTAVCV